MRATGGDGVDTGLEENIVASEKFLLIYNHIFHIKFWIWHVPQAE